MRKIILSIALLSSSVIASANNFIMPGFNNNNGYGNGSSWTMPPMNWGNGNNGFNNGSNWSMPAMNWGNATNSNNWGGNNWTVPAMNWGNGNNNGSNWNMPNMNWGNSNNIGNGFNNGSNWTMPMMNWGNGNNNYAPNVQYRAPVMPVAPQFIPRLTNKVNVQAPVAMKPAIKASTPATSTKKTPLTSPKVLQKKIPTPSEVKGVILAPSNKSIELKTTK